MLNNLNNVLCVLLQNTHIKSDDMMKTDENEH